LALLDSGVPPPSQILDYAYDTCSTLYTVLLTTYKTKLTLQSSELLYNAAIVALTGLKKT